MCRYPKCKEDEFEVDGVVYNVNHTSTHTREILEVIDPHSMTVKNCVMCTPATDDSDRWAHMIYDGMRWDSNCPVLRFTSDGLQDNYTLQEV